MQYNLNSILQRMYVVTKTENNYQLSKYLGKGSGVIHGWKNKKTPPYEECHRIAEKTGCNLMWLITGKSDEDAAKPSVANYEIFRKEFLATLGQAYQMGYISHTVKTTDDNLNLMAEMMYEGLTGEVSATTSAAKDMQKNTG